MPGGDTALFVQKDQRGDEQWFVGRVLEIPKNFFSRKHANRKRQAETIASLQKQVEEAKQQVQDIAVKAIEGASGSRALAHVNQIAIEQAKNRPQG
jgi:phage terminase large subunit-like protein